MPPFAISAIAIAGYFFCFAADAAHYFTLPRCFRFGSHAVARCCSRADSRFAGHFDARRL